jgi:pimeloyl-ACP methyl ester carboxylesterase
LTRNGIPLTPCCHTWTLLFFNKGQMQEYHKYTSPGIHCSEQMLKVANNVSIRIIHFTPETDSAYPPLVMVVGLATAIESFEFIIKELTKDFEIYYVETREKSSSQINGKVSFDMETVAGDIIETVNLLGLPGGGYILFGYSFSATVIIESYSRLKAKPASLLLLSPTPSFYYPSWSLFLIRMAVPLYRVLKPTAKWYLRNFTINVKEDKDMYRYSSLALDNADPRKLRDAILAIAGYEVWNKLDSLDCSTLIVDTSKDGIHRHEDIMRMRNLIKNCMYVDLETNNRTHGNELGPVIRRFLNEQTMEQDFPSYINQ